MRILFTAGPFYGHVNTLLPLALAAREAGHEIALATGATLVARLEERGLPAWAAGPAGFRAADGSRPASWLKYFADSAAHRLADLLPRARAWRPDLVVHEETELAGPVVAAVCGARHVAHGLSLMPSQTVWAALSETIDRLAHAHGRRDVAEAVRQAPYLHICPPALQAPEPPLWPDARPLRPVPGTDAAAAARRGRRRPDLLRRPLVHLTLGTVFHDNTHVLESAIAGLSRLPVDVIVTVGPDGDPERFGRPPPNVLIERYVAHSALLPRCQLVVSQGGAGVMFGALAHGVPQLVLPQGADQFANAEACARSGAGVVLMPDHASADDIATQALQVLGEPAFRAAAQRVGAEIERMPDAASVLPSLTAAAALCA
jgi:UDP:flavonoid glycosyltransferase YjiC (YdhE family)